ncbi:mucin-15 [Protobothrops mucrosquamatus]|uniref:mucin-15 n=1 Tax=Protobothrops mucrosquamatus TaxID=103944 RepID=UPI000775F39E|nr:mucin-15 [Protobothrops mucrosquamatus]XP_015678529.1 mucin-15 [Protobothrops mucrosquamatus]
MRTTEGILFMLLLISLQLARNHSEDAVNSTSSRSSVSSTPMSPTPFNVTSDRTSTERSNTSDSPNDSTITESNTPSNKTTSTLTPTSSLHTVLLPTTHPPTLTTKDVKHRVSSSGMPANTSRSYEATTYFKSFETESNSVTTTTPNISFPTTVSHNTTQVDGLTFRPTKNLSNTTAMLLTTKSSAVTTELSTSVPTTNLPPKATAGSTEAREAPKESHSNGGVIFGTIVGVMLGSALIGLVGYLICGKRKSESFGHQRLYDDTRNDPVLRLDATPEPFNPNFGDLSYYNPMAANENHVQNHKETSYNAIPMDDMTSSQPSAEMHKARS